MAKFHGEYVVKVQVAVRVEAESLQEAQNLVERLSIDVGEADGVDADEWDTTPEAVYLFEGEE